MGKQVFACERSLSKADIKRYGDGPVPDGSLLGVTTGDLGEKEALLSPGLPGVFDTPERPKPPQPADVTLERPEPEQRNPP